MMRRPWYKHGNRLREIVPAAAIAWAAEREDTAARLFVAWATENNLHAYYTLNADRTHQSDMQVKSQIAALKRKREMLTRAAIETIKLPRRGARSAKR